MIRNYLILLTSKNRRFNQLNQFVNFHQVIDGYFQISSEKIIER